MNIDHVGFLWQLDDADVLEAVARRLAVDPTAASENVGWATALRPLELLRDGDSPPVGLAERTIARVVELKPRPGRQPDESPTPRNWWRSRADIGVAACLLVVLCGLGLGGVSRWRLSAAATECRMNMHRLYQGLDQYAVLHDGHYPTPGVNTPDPTAGSFVQVLNQTGVLDPATRTSCPGVRSSDAASAPVDYTYSLGFRDESGAVHGLLRTDGEFAPVLADRPLNGWTARTTLGNHSNGANVLFAAGNVRYVTAPTVGWNGDNIFLNDAQRIAAGLRRHDAVLGENFDRP